jgi:hypothetical protein
VKRKIAFILLFTLVFSLTGCGSESATTETVANETTEVNTEEADEVADEVAEEEMVVADSSVDIDLTALSSTMVYSEVFNMMMEPVAYEGQTVKMDGNCAIYTDEETGKTYYACVVQDATQCCSQGLEFLLDESQYTEEDYPKEGDPLVIKGTFTTYEEDGGTYIAIKDSVME